MAYKTFGNGPLLVCLHPIGLSGQIWGKYVPDLGRFHSVVPMDLPGHGQSPPLSSECAVSAMADVVASELEHLADQYTLLGASLGGMVAQELALRRPKGLAMLILVDTLSSVTDAQRVALQQRAAAVREHGISAVIDATIERWFTPAFIRENLTCVAQIRAMLSVCDPRIHAECWEAIAAFDLEDRLPEISVPVCAIAGSEDVSTPPALARAIAARVQEGHCQIIPGAGHMSMIEKPHEFAQIVSDFILGKWS